MAQIFAGFFSEGSTDVSFLKPIVEKTLVNIAFDCHGQLDIELIPLNFNKTGLNFINQILDASKKGFEDFGMMILFVQTDADNRNLADTYTHKINPAINELTQQSELEYCKLLVAIVPIQETEAWMLADVELLKRQIGTQKTDAELQINRDPESIANPKEVIQNAIRIARQDLTKRRRRDLDISDLYGMGQEMGLESLEKLSSFVDFKNNLRRAFIDLNLLAE